jgi:hypothetical protein
MQLTRILREGFIAGLIGAAAVALWFLIVDAIAGRPFFTPAMLGSAVFFGEQDPAKVVIAFSRIVPYTMLHVCAFIIVGTVAAALAAEVEVAPPTLYLIVVTFAVFEAGRALNTVGSPVNGFVPSRALRAFTSFRLTLMKPGRMVTASPLRTLFVTTSCSASSTAAAVRFSTPAASATARSNSVFVMSLSPWLWFALQRLTLAPRDRETRDTPRAPGLIGALAWGDVVSDDKEFGGCAIFELRCSM